MRLHTFCDTPGAHNFATSPFSFFFHEYNMAKVTEKIHINDVYNGKTSLSAAANSSFLHFFIYGKLNRCDKVRHYQTPFSGKSNLCFSPFCYFHSYLRCSCCSFDLLIKIQSSICSLYNFCQAWP